MPSGGFTASQPPDGQPLAKRSGLLYPRVAKSLTWSTPLTADPLVTIGLTCFNARDTIGRAIASAQAQDWPAVEIVVVDDCSSDDSPSVVRKLAEQDRRIRLIVHEHNGGAAVARNTILANANGEFVAFFDDDDASLPSRVNRQIEVLLDAEAATGSRLIACYAGGERLYDNGYKVEAPAIGSQGELPHGPGVANYLLFYERNPAWFNGAGTPTCALLARHSTFKTLGGFDPAFRLIEDAELAIRLALAGGYFVGTAECLYVRYMTGGQEKSPEAFLKARLGLAEKHKSYLQSVGRYQYAKIWPQLRYWHFKRKYHRFLLSYLRLLASNPVAGTKHLMVTGPRRLIHEARMRMGTKR